MTDDGTRVQIHLCMNTTPPPLSPQLRPLFRYPVDHRPPLVPISLPESVAAESRPEGKRRRQDAAGVTTTPIRMPQSLGQAATDETILGYPEVPRDVVSEFGHRVNYSHARSGTRHLSWGETSWGRQHATSLLRLVGSFSDGSLPVADALIVGGIYGHIGEEASTVIQTYAPTANDDSWAEIGPFVRDVVGVAAPRTAYTARLLMSPVTQYVMWCRQHAGFPLDANVLFRRATIEHYIGMNTARISEGTLRNRRAILLRISEILLPDENPYTMRALNASNLQAPYSGADLARFSNWARGQNTPLRRRKAAVMLCLCAGAGLRSSDIARLTRKQITIDRDGILVRIEGERAREIPLLARWEPLLRDALTGLSDDSSVFGITSRESIHTVVARFVERTIGEDRPRSNRLRASWLVTHLSAGTPMKALMLAAGISRFENLSKYLLFVPELDTPTYRALLRLEATR